MAKAYVKNGVITLLFPNGKKTEFIAGTLLTELGSKGKQTPYAALTGANSAFYTFAKQELSTLYALGKQTPAALLSLLDQNRSKKVYTQNAFTCSLESIDGEAVLVVNIASAVDLFVLELMCAVNRQKPLKKCAHCGNFFFPTGRSDSVYCDRVGKDGFSCKKIGAHRRYRKESAQNTAKTLYQNTLKRYRYLKSKGSITESEFIRWRNSATDMYTQFINGTVSESALTEFLTENKTPKTQSRNSISDYLL